MLHNLSRFLIALGLLALAGCAAAKGPTVGKESSAAPHPGLSSFASMPVYFIENRGQTDARAAYYIRGKDKAIYFTAEGVAFSLARSERDPSGLLMRASYGAPERWLVKLDFVGANRVTPAGGEPTPALFSYMKGPREEWKTGLKTYSKLVYADLWPGIDLVYSGTSGRLKYEFVVNPGADPRQVRLAYRGASSVRLDESGALEITTPVGAFRDDKPYAYQEIDGRRVAVAMTYRLEGDSGYGFRLGEYDSKKPLVLDPAILIYSGFIGGAGDDSARGIAIDGDGAAYVTGETASNQTSFPDTSGAFDRTQNGGIDAFVAKVKPDGTGLVYATFIGGAGDDRGLAIALEQGCAPPCAAYIAGDTDSDEDTFPSTSGAFQETHQGGTDAFVAKLKDDGTDLLFLTYFGGSGDETAHGIAVDIAGNIFIAGETKSTENSSPNPFPVTAGAFDTQGGGVDAFFARILPDGSDVVFSGFIGGAGDDRGNAIALEPSCADPCDLYIAGETSSGQSTFPVTAGPDLTHNGNIDGFVAKLLGDGSALDYLGYIGGGNTDRANGIAVDQSGKAYVAGETNSGESSFPDGDGFNSLPGFAQIQNGGVDAFLVRVKADGTGLEYATYIGGANDDRANAVAVQPGCLADCKAFVAGETDSDQTTFPDKVGPDVTFNGGIDAFIAVLDTSVDGNTSLVSAGFLGGAGDDRANAIAVDDHGSAFVAGESGALPVGSTARFPGKNGPDTSQNGGIDAFVTKICLEGCLDLTIKMTTTAKAVLPGGAISYTITVTNKGPDDAHNVVIEDPLPGGSGFISAPGCSDSPPPVIVTCTTATLVKGTPFVVTINITAPTGVGNFSNSATVSSDETDTNPSGNTSTVKTSVTLPDLTIKKITLSAATVPSAGGSITVFDTTSNKQSVSAGASMTRFFLSSDKILGGDTPAGSRAIGSLAPKQSDVDLVGTSVTIPASPQGTIWYVIAVADADGDVAEISETNNTKLSKKITVGP